MKARERDLIDPEEYHFTFGKYKSEFYGDVREKDPHYIQWCDDNLHWFNLTDEEREYIDNLVAEDYDAYGAEYEDYWYW